MVPKARRLSIEEQTKALTATPSVVSTHTAYNNNEGDALSLPLIALNRNRGTFFCFLLLVISTTSLSAIVSLCIALLYRTLHAIIIMMAWCYVMKHQG